MVRVLALVLGLQWLGEIFTLVLPVPVPGPVVGMVLLLGLLAATSGRLAGPTLDGVASGLLAHLSLLFVPAGVGVIVHLDRLAEGAPPMLAALLLGTTVTLLATGWITQKLLPPQEGSGS